MNSDPAEDWNCLGERWVGCQRNSLLISHGCHTTGWHHGVTRGHQFPVFWPRPGTLQVVVSRDRPWRCLWRPGPRDRGRRRRRRWSWTTPAPAWFLAPTEEGQRARETLDYLPPTQKKKKPSTLNSQTDVKKKRRKKKEKNICCWNCWLLTSFIFLFLSFSFSGQPFILRSE